MTKHNRFIREMFVNRPSWCRHGNRDGLLVQIHLKFKTAVVFKGFVGFMKLYLIDKDCSMWLYFLTFFLSFNKVYKSKKPVDTKRVLHRPGGENSMTDRLVSQTTSQILLQDLRRIIEEARQGVASTVNTALTMLYRHVGNRINQEILKGKRLGNKP